MIALAFLFLAAHTIAYPKWEILIASQPYENFECEEETGALDQQLLKEMCQLNTAEYGGPEKCMDIFNAYAGTKCYNETKFTNLDSYLSGIDKSTKIVVVKIYSDDPVKVDLNKLPTRMQVYLEFQGAAFEDEPDPDTNPDTQAGVELMARKSRMVKRMSKALDSLLQKPIKHRKLKDQIEIPLLKLVGGIKEKVSFLIIYAITIFEIVDSDLDVPVFVNCMQQFAGTQKFNVDRFYNLVAHPFPERLTTEEVTFFDMSSPDWFYPIWNYTIILEKDKFVCSMSTQDDRPQERTFDYDYSLTKNIGFIAYFGTNITIHREAEGLLPNLSLDFDIFLPILGPMGEISSKVGLEGEEESKLLEKREIIISKTGDWSDVEKGAFNLKLGFNSDLYSVNAKEFEEVATITTTEPRNPVNEYVTGGDDDDDGPNIGMIIGIVIACVVVVAAIIVVVVIVIRKKKAQVGAS